MNQAQISTADILSVAHEINANLSIGEIAYIQAHLKDEAENDPEAEWNLWVENLIYEVKSIDL